MAGRKNYKETIRVTTVGADFDIEHYLLFKDMCETLGLCGSELIRQLIYPHLDDFKEQRDKVMREYLGMIGAD